jgi:hypothetical protein
MKKIPQQDDEKKRAQVWVEILFHPKKTEHYGSFIRCEHGTKTNFENMTNFAIPLVILTWHQMIQEYFWKNEEKTFFQYGNYMPQKQRFPKEAIDLYMIDSCGNETQIKSLTWHRMIQEYFWKNEEKTFFQYGNYMPRKQRFPKEAIDLYMIDSCGNETQIKSFDMIRPNADADVFKDACLSLLE